MILDLLLDINNLSQPTELRTYNTISAGQFCDMKVTISFVINSPVSSTDCGRIQI